MLQILCLKRSKNSFLEVRFYLASTNKAIIISEMNFVARQIYKYTYLFSSSKKWNVMKWGNVFTISIL